MDLFAGPTIIKLLNLLKNFFFLEGKSNFVNNVCLLYHKDMKSKNISLDLVNHPRFKWTPGMKSLQFGPSGANGRVVNLSTEPAHRGLFVVRGDRGALEKGKSVPVTNTSCQPDLDDPATAGILFQNLLEISSRVDAYKGTDLNHEESWIVTTDSIRSFGKSFGEACARALLLVWQ